MTKTDYIAEFGFEILNPVELIWNMGFRVYFSVTVKSMKELNQNQAQYCIDLPKEMCN